MIEPSNSSVLIANPHLTDPNFIRAVIFICEHNQEGSFGFILNKKLGRPISYWLPDLAGYDIPVYEGGPVELNTLHFIHQYPDEIPGGQKLLPGIFWGGSFELLITNILNGQINASKIKFFKGYSGWDSGQLKDEIAEKTWIVAKGSRRLLFPEQEDNLWKQALSMLGGEYQLLLNAPIDPSLN